MSSGSHVAVVGGGIAGLAAAHRLGKLGASVTVLEAGGRLGGKIQTETFAGHRLDAGAEALLTRVPEALALCRELGLGPSLVEPASDQPFVWVGGRLRPLPPRLLAGVPGGLRAVLESGILSPYGLARAGLDLLVPSRAPADDVSIGRLVRRRLGGEVLERLIDPLLGGIHAGSCDALSVRATAPQLELALRSRRGLVRGLRAATGGARSTPAGPAFVSVRGGLEEVVHALRARLADVEVQTGAAVEEVAPLPGGRVRLALSDERAVEADGAVLAVPAFAAARLLRRACPVAAEELGAIEYASVATVMLAYRRSAMSMELEGSGFLVPPTQRLVLTACTWSSSKWTHLGGDTVLIKGSVGSAGDGRALELGDDALACHAHADLARLMGVREQPLHAHVVRFDDALPQYHVGHLDRVARIEAALAGGLPAVQLAGAAYRGVGVGSCIRDGERAAARVADRLICSA